MLKINTIYNEDCLVTMGNMENNSVDIVFTSPPYNRKRNDKYTHYDDNIIDYYGFLTGSIMEMIRVSKGYVFVNIQKNYYNKSDVFKLIGEFCDSICEIFVWEKSNPMPAQGFNITNAYEFIICFGNKLKSNTTYTKNHLRTSTNKMHKDHKAIMNPFVSDFFISNFTKENDIVYDPFMGMGTTAKSCIKHNRNYIGSEIARDYVDVCNKELGVINVV